MSRNDRDVTVSYPEVLSLRDALGAIDAVLDGELVAFDPATGAAELRHAAEPHAHRRRGDRRAAGRPGSRSPTSSSTCCGCRASRCVRLPYRDRGASCSSSSRSAAAPCQTVPVFFGTETPAADVWQRQHRAGHGGRGREAGRLALRAGPALALLDQGQALPRSRGGHRRLAPRCRSTRRAHRVADDGHPRRPSGLRYVGQVGTGFTESQLDALRPAVRAARAPVLTVRRRAAERGRRATRTGSSRRSSARSRSANGRATACCATRPGAACARTRHPADVVVAPIG